MLKLSSDVSETFVLTLNGEAADADAGGISDEEARLFAEMFLNTSVILYRASIDKSEGKLSISGRNDNRKGLLPTWSLRLSSLCKATLSERILLISLAAVNKMLSFVFPLTLGFPPVRLPEQDCEFSILFDYSSS